MKMKCHNDLDLQFRLYSKSCNTDSRNVEIINKKKEFTMQTAEIIFWNEILDEALRKKSPNQD